MYRLSLIPRKVITVTDEVIAQGPLDAEADPRILLAAIQIAEERFIKPALGKAFYYDFRDKKNVIVTDINNAYLTGLINAELEEAITLKDGDVVNSIELVSNPWYVTLWNEHLWKLCAECIVFVASPTNYSRFTASGEMENSPKSITDGQGAATIDLQRMRWKMDKLLQDRIDPLMAAMKEWLCDNKDQFPLYDARNCRCEDGVSTQRKTGWIFGAYDQLDRRNERYSSFENQSYRDNDCDC